MRGAMIIFSLALLFTISSLYGHFAELDTVEIDSMEWNGAMMKIA